MMKTKVLIVLIFHQIILIQSSPETSSLNNNSSTPTSSKDIEKKSNGTDSKDGNFTLTLVNIKTKDGDDNKKKEMLYYSAQNQYPSGPGGPGGGPGYGQFIPGGQGSPLPPALLNILRQRQLQQQQSM